MELSKYLQLSWFTHINVFVVWDISTSHYLISNLMLNVVNFNLTFNDQWVRSLEIFLKIIFVQGKKGRKSFNFIEY